MTQENWDLRRDLEKLRNEFPILREKAYLISNSLGAVPREVRTDLESYYALWASEGVSAWRMKWWDLSREIGNLVGEIIGAAQDEITMMTHATQAHWVALSTAFRFPQGERREILMTDHDFPSTIYAVSQIAACMGWQVNMVPSHGQQGIPVENILSRISTRTDFYVGGCLKWLCGGPGSAFLYVEPDAAARLKPALTGWLAHSLPFGFSSRMEYTEKSYRFMSGTPPVPCLYAARSGLDIIRKIGEVQIRGKSLRLTDYILEQSYNRGFDVFTPRQKEFRGGAVSLGIPHAFQVKQALDDIGILIDFRKGRGDEPDVIRIGPHFYTDPNEIAALFEAMDDIYKKESFRKYSPRFSHVT